MLIFQKMLTVFILMAIGFLFGRKGWINDDNSGLLSKIVINVANPGMIIAAGLSGSTTFSNQLILNTFLMALAFYTMMVVTAPLVMRIMRIPADSRGTYQYMYVFGNIGFMGMPLVVAIYGSEYALLVAVFNFVFTLLMYTYGIGIVRKEAAVNTQEQAQAGTITGPSVSGAAAQPEGTSAAEESLSDNPQKGSSQHPAGRTSLRNVVRNVVNIGTISSIIAMLCFLTKVQVPDFLYDAFEMMSNLACPLSMFVIGASLAVIAPKKLVSDMRLNVFILVRLIIIPIIGIAVVKYLIAPEELLLKVFAIMISVPFASTSVMVAQEYGGRKDIASRGVAFSTLISVITIPMVSAIMGV